MTSRASLLPLFVAVLAGLPRVSLAQDTGPAGYSLYRVATGPQPFDGALRSPTLLEADANGGRAVADVRFLGDCKEHIEFTWSFDKDIRWLKPEETITVTMTATVGGECGRDPFLIVNTGTLAASILQSMGEFEKSQIYGMQWALGQTEAEARMHAKAEGVGTSVIKAAGGVRHAPRLWFAVDLAAITPVEGFVWQIAYLYHGAPAGTPPAATPITLDSPRRNPPATQPTFPPGDGRVSPPATPPASPPTFPPGSSPGSPPGQQPPMASPTAPCLDPALEACIDSWLDRLIFTLSRRAPDRAPWSISPYGHLLNNQVQTFAAPDGWATTYHSSKYCFIWANYSNAHLDPVLSGELQPLRQACIEPSSPAAPIPDAPSATGSTGDLGPSAPPGPTGATTRTLLAEHRVVQSGQTAIVPVHLLNPGGTAYMNCEVAFDPALVYIRAATRGSGLGEGVLFESNIADHGRIRIAFADARGLNANAVVANLVFEAIAISPDISPLTLKVTDVGDSSGRPLPITLVHGSITIGGPTDPLRGDCDGDGRITSADALCALRMSVGLLSPSPALDVTGDREVTSDDARAILQRGN